MDGIVNAIMDYRAELEKRGHSVYIFAPGSQKTIAENRDSHVHYFSSLAFPPYPDYGLAIWPYGSHKILAELGIDIIHNHGEVTMAFAAIRAAKKLNLPLLSSFHTLLPEGGHYIAESKIVKDAARTVAWAAFRRLYSTSNAVTAPSMAMKMLMEKNGIRPVEYLPNGIDVNRFRPGGAGKLLKRRLGLQKNKVILTVGRLVKEKNLALLIRAAPKILAENPDAVFLFVGRGPHEQYYKKLASQSPARARLVFAGFMPGQELVSYYQCADIFAFPSTFETQGLCALEAMACGKPVAAADCLATTELVKGKGTGVLFDAADPQDCAEKINSLIPICGEKDIGDNALRVAKEFSVERCTDRLEGLYARLAGRL